MKKLVIAIAIVLGMGMGMSTYAQEGTNDEERGLFGMGATFDRGGDRTPNLPNGGEHGGTGDGDAGDTPIGSGIAVLTALGAAYLVGKRRKED